MGLRRNGDGAAIAAPARYGRHSYLFMYLCVYVFIYLFMYFVLFIYLFT